MKMLYFGSILNKCHTYTAKSRTEDKNLLLGKYSKADFLNFGSILIKC